MATKKVVIKKVAKKVVEKEQPVELKKLVIKIHGKELMLTPQEAKELKGILDELFEESKEIEKVLPVPYPYPVYPWREVIYVKPWTWEYHPMWTTIGTGNMIYTANGLTNGVATSWTCGCANNGTFTCSCG
jgi:hypothetical protein